MHRIVKLKVITEIAEKAGAITLAWYQKEVAVDYKADQSPVTAADLAANHFICQALRERYPEIPLLSEENKAVSYSERAEWETFFLIDPIDGTKEFINQSDQFTVNIALIHRGVPVLGVVYAPALKAMYTACQGQGAFKNGRRLPFKKNAKPDQSLTVVASKNHLSVETEQFIKGLTESTEKVTMKAIGSSLKLCLVATGEADLYPRLGPTMEWDTAAAHAVVLAAGKQVLQFGTDKPLVYNKADLLNPWFIVQ
ncbi:MAG TPA: 3'(2'),5'-bisphosphate nucleotidase CysQ [Methylococcaceae bacterium]|jgi:3'(2'), 5'-bisphosphate nucleotidase|nr:3'(2'),5'-bisphosphate nucleotidase CysQ [Methylococcaceae bacterium]HIN68052.1 3'(2'),5'-bisphosphate nucleotidase [Methylococcales bacterium]HIA46209.1 3'(2'),5'-bisphosphate nucleotidase CysQ [Methylococcaceae bacterium]HIB63507.1 3'(2'),5'-bisphosphate nucleotidase CysQ [Methylococcaceae bacterium]HIO12370.1 3'(2'),5'-bisphosphate nucleotidase [Methylococcales bacterium]